MQEKLIEYWLDSVNERTYQPAFLQMLSGQGHTVVHSTRHMAIEFGKDVVSIDADGIPCAFQLKGNPGSRLTLKQFREIKPQIDELVEQRIVYPGIPDVAHKCYLVTNGEIEEEVQRAVDDLNMGYKNRGFEENTRLHLISRGKLLAWTIEHASTFWPDGFFIHEKLIKFYNENGKSAPRLDLLSEGLEKILKLTESKNRISIPDFERRQISAAVFVALAVRNYAREKNHIAVAGAYAVLFASLAASEHRQGNPNSKKSALAKSVARDAFFAATIDMTDELAADISTIENDYSIGGRLDYNDVFLTGNILSDRFLWRARAQKTASIVSILNIESNRGGQKSKITDTRRKTIDIITRPQQGKFWLWGEAAIPQILASLWNWRLCDSTKEPTLLEWKIIRSLLSEVIGGDRGYIATPYHTVEDSIRDKINEIIKISGNNVQKDTLKKSSYFAESIFHCFIRSNLKSRAKSLWPDLTRVIHNSFLPDKSWEYCLWRIQDGTSQAKLLEKRQLWTDLQQEAANIETPNIPHGLRNDPVMLLAFVLFAPHRAMPEVVRYLHFAICGTWFLPSKRPNI